MQYKVVEKRNHGQFVLLFFSDEVRDNRWVDWLSRCTNACYPFHLSWAVSLCRWSSVCVWMTLIAHCVRDHELLPDNFHCQLQRLATCIHFVIIQGSPWIKYKPDNAVIYSLMPIAALSEKLLCGTQFTGLKRDDLKHHASKSGKANQWWNGEMEKWLCFDLHMATSCKRQEQNKYDKTWLFHINRVFVENGKFSFTLHCSCILWKIAFRILWLCVNAIAYFFDVFSFGFLHSVWTKREGPCLMYFILGFWNGRRWQDRCSCLEKNGSVFRSKNGSRLCSVMSVPDGWA